MAKIANYRLHLQSADIADTNRFNLLTLRGTILEKNRHKSSNKICICHLLTRKTNDVHQLGNCDEDEVVWFHLEMDLQHLP